jgi:diguanylate cyclase (GGDEF)-like protein
MVMTGVVLVAEGEMGERLQRLLAGTYALERPTIGVDLPKQAQSGEDAVFVVALRQPLGDFLTMLGNLRRLRRERRIVVVSDGVIPAQAALSLFRQGACDVAEQFREQPHHVQQAIASAVADQRLMTEGTQLVQQLVDRNYLLSRMHELLDQIHRAPDVEALLTGVLPALREISGAAAVAIVLAGNEGLKAGWPLPHDVPADRTVPLLLDDKTIGIIHLQGPQLFAGYAISPEDLFISLSRQLTLAIYHHQVLRSAQDQAARDGLTLLFNHAYYRQGLQAAFDCWHRYDRPFSVIMLDLDSFKATNDRFGHPTGDAVLASVGRELALNTRTADVAARYGGDEFAVILADTTFDGAMVVAERMDQAIRALRLPGVGPVGISMGVTAVGASDRAGDDVLLRADTALRQAKTDGKRRVYGMPNERKAGDGMSLQPPSAVALRSEPA